jgi:hypothetical protein
MESEVVLTHNGVSYVPADEAVLRVRAASGLSISGAYRRIANARAAGLVRTLLVSRKQRWFAEVDLVALIASMKEEA